MPIALKDAYIQGRLTVCEKRSQSGNITITDGSGKTFARIPFDVTFEKNGRPPVDHARAMLVCQLFNDALKKAGLQ